MNKLKVFVVFLLNIGWCITMFEDEMQVYESECLGEDKFTCMGGGCIDQAQYCDGTDDCDDASDETFCLGRTPDAVLCNETHQYMCEDKTKCIPSTWICNVEVDCADGSDEANCTALAAVQNATCKGFLCGDGKCISSLWVCDGVYDCDDRSDEYSQDVCRHTSISHSILNGAFCPEAKGRNYKCLDSSYCLPQEMMCDGMKDCRDGSDEGTFCAKWHSMCDSYNCSSDAACFPDRFGPACYCRGTYLQYNHVTRTCDEQNMCLQERPECSHFCVHKGNHFLCECDEGYRKDDFRYLCYATGPEAKLFFSTRNEIKYITVKSKHIVTVATQVKQAHGVSFDGTYLYWVETAQGHQSIFKAQLDDIKDTKQVLVGLGLEDPGDVAVDWLGGNIYFSDAERGVISACRADGSICTTIRTQAKHPRFVTLDARNGVMYWADWHDRAVIMTSRMDGSHPQVLVDHMRTFASGLALDAPNARLYFVDKTVRVVMTESKHVYSLFEEPFHYPYSVAVFENTVFWSDWTTNTIQTTDKLHSAALKRDVLLSLDVPVIGMHLYHPVLMNNTINPCRSNNCSHLCFVTSNTSHVCGCPDTMDMVDNQCRHTGDYRPKYLVVAGGQLFTKIQYDTLGNPESHATHFDIGRVQAMAYDSLRDSLYLYDGQRKTLSYINMTDFTLGITHVLVYSGFENVVDMDYDYATDSIYILDAGRRSMEVMSLKTQKRGLVHRFEDQEVPISFCLLPDYGKMLVALVENELHNNIVIDAMGMDGAGRKHVVNSNLKGPHIRLRYVSHMDNVYIADESNGAIDYIHHEGTGRENYRELSTTVTSLAIADNYVFWTDRRTPRLFWADIHETTQKIRRIDLAIFPNNSQLLIQATVPHPPKNDPLLKHPCLTQNPCSDICIQTPHSNHFADPAFRLGYKCLCPPGQVSNGGVCAKPTYCGENQLFCHRSNACFAKEERCDGKKDCAHGEDEEGCVMINPALCSPNDLNPKYPCPSGDPHDHAVTDVMACSESEFGCSDSSICIPRSLVCDGRSDCPDSSDEVGADCDTLSCIENEFMCTSGSCILKSWVCDGDDDCNDGSDEVDCQKIVCAPGFYQCRNRECIALASRCDGQQDCFDFSDEEDCEEPTIVEYSAVEPHCAEGEYSCEYNTSICLPQTARCNLKIDCPGGTDENGCVFFCSSSGFWCKQELKCISQRKVCNQRSDCADSSDETPEACALVNKTSDMFPTPVDSKDECVDGYQCANGQCLHWNQVCDGREDCFDATDEHGLCATSCENNNCPFDCQPTPQKLKCRCPTGFRPDHDQSCIDIDECAEEVCSQGCINVPGSFLCSCHHGYALRSDRRSCKAKRGNMSLLYVSVNSVRSISSDGYGAVEFNDPNISRITDLDYNVRQKKLYVTSADAKKLIEVNSTKDFVTVTNIGRPTRVAVDWVTGNVYFVDSTPSASCMRVCDLRKKMCARLQKLPSDAKVTALIVDPSSRRMFYCVTRELESVVWSASLSGHQVTDLTTVSNCTGLAVDTFKKKLYVAETGPAHIIRMDYEGESHKKILSDHPQLQAPHGLAIFGDHIYYLVANSFRLGRCQIFGRKHCETYIYRVFDANTFVIRHESIQRDDLKNECEGMVCSNVCALGEAGPMCLCNDGSFSKKGDCDVVPKEQLPLFNGWSPQDLSSAHHVSFTVIGAVLALFGLYMCSFLYYHFVYKPRRARASTYTEVRFQNTQADDMMFTGAPSVQMTSEAAISNEFVNPLQYVRNAWYGYGSYRKNTRPTATASLSIDLHNSPPQADFSDTESDLDDKDIKRFIKRK